ncbi:putative endo-1,3-1,4-beta-D-glucanase [Dactylonectria macrodidyma]|uniref:Endo-1,3-1,4-beta-D-glucanase n=1 Tax=Dactylonectria macrodidyma TaxID=307937 RepID=A0A9P9DLE4_9HYPO|nr:putative endo-1,3-1,4-beta-D-glucanase [Dactylonectria macrodidyma]
MSDCCLKGFQWNAKPKGRDAKLVILNCYITGSNKDRFTNTRLLADQYAEEVGATVYIPDIFKGEVIPADILNDQSRWAEMDVPGFLERNSKAIRGSEVIECAGDLRSQHKRIGSIGFCYGGWGVFLFGTKANPLVDCITTAHPSQLEEIEIENVGVPVQIMAPEKDPWFTDELKAFSNRYFPGLEHGFAVRGEREGMERAKNAAVLWFQQWLK